MNHMRTIGSRKISDTRNNDTYATRGTLQGVRRHQSRDSSGPSRFPDGVPAWIEDFRKDISKSKAPTLILHGDADRILPPDATSGGRRS